MNYPNRVWEPTGTKVIKENGEEFTVNTWSSHEPNDEDRLRRRKASLEADKRRDQRKPIVKDLPAEPLRRKG